MDAYWKFGAIVVVIIAALVWLVLVAPLSLGATGSRLSM